MAYNYSSSLVAFLFISNILLAMTGQAFAGRDIPTNSKNVDKKQPEWFFGSDGSFLIPGIGRMPVLPSDGSGGTGTPVGGSTGADIPGGDDTIIPNPGFEVPNPAAGGIIPAPPSP